MARSAISDETRARVLKAWPAILDALASGAVVNEVLKKHKLTRGIMCAFLATEPNARNEWETAKEVSAEEFFDRLVQLATSKFGDIEPSRARAVMDSYKWLAAKRNPKVYSDRAQLDVTVKTIDLTRIITEANARLKAGREVLQASRAITVDMPALPVTIEAEAQEV